METYFIAYIGSKIYGVGNTAQEALEAAALELFYSFDRSVKTADMQTAPCNDAVVDAYMRIRKGVQHFQFKIVDGVAVLA